jgi:predicted transposase YbfD/YdcC
LPKKTLEHIVNTKNHAIVQIKDNQSIIYSEAIGISQECECISTDYQKHEKAHGRIESRRARVFEVTKLLKNTCSEWKEVKCIIEIKRTRQEFDTREKRHKEPTIEYSYYASTEIYTARKFLKWIRDHWKIENLNHYVKDVTFNEDKSRIRVNPMIFAILRSFALNILRINNFKNISMARFSNCLNFNKLLSLKGIA